MIYRHIKYRIYPTKQQEEQIQKTFSYCRKMYNLLLEDKIKYYNEKKKMLKNTPAQYKEKYPYFKEVDSLALANVQQQLMSDYKKFFNTGKHFPRFKTKKHNNKYYTTYNKVGFDTIAVFDNYIKMPKLKRIKAKIHRQPFQNGVIKSLTIRQENDDKYYADILFECINDKESCVIDKTNAIGLDYKNNGLYMDSNGIVANMPYFYQNQLNKIKHESRKLSRKQGGVKSNKPSNNYLKQKKKLAKLHKHIANQRKDFLHKKSTEIANQYDIICVESLSMKHIANKKMKLGQTTLNNGYYFFINTLEYKMKQRGKILVKVDKWYPSSQICSICGERHKIKLSERTFTCNCGNVMDRDYNASRNILHEGLRMLAI